MSASMDVATLQVLGRILSCGYIACGFLPVRIAFPTLASMLLHPLDIPSEMLVETFRECLNPVDTDTLNEAISCRASFPQHLLNRLISMFSLFECLEVPKPSNLLKLCEQSARYTFLTKPFAVISEMRRGISRHHLQFWRNKGVQDLRQILLALSVNSVKVLNSIEEPLVLFPAEQKVFGYLTQYIGRMKIEEVQQFLRFCTGSSVCIVKPISVTFNSTSGLARRPIAHTCDCSLELSRTYSSFLDFSSEFNLVLGAEDNGWRIDAI